MTENPNYTQPAGWSTPKKSRWWLWLVGIVAALAVIILLGLLLGKDKPASTGSSFTFSTGSSYTEIEEMTTPDYPYLARLDLAGTMSVDTSYADFYGYDHQWLLEQIDELMADSNNAGLLLYVNSGGGEVAAAAELGDKIQEYQDTTGRPVVAFGYGVNASGAYWASCTADKLVLDTYCITGSIGVTMGTLLDVSGLLAKYNITAYNLVSGDEKNATNSLTPISPKTLEIYQGIINEYYGYFVKWVANQRGLTESVVAPLADGRIYTAKQAVAKGLADQVGDYDTAEALLQEASGVNEVVDMTPPESLNSFLDYLFSSQLNDTAWGLLLEDMQVTGALAYYQE